MVYVSECVMYLYLTKREIFLNALVLVAQKEVGRRIQSSTQCVAIDASCNLYVCDSEKQ